MTMRACLTVDYADYTPIDGDSLHHAGVQAEYPGMLMHAPDVKGASRRWKGTRSFRTQVLTKSPS
jgi:hypothetical protein